MSVEDKLIYHIRLALIEKHGEEYLQLSEKEQALLICDVFKQYVDSLKKAEE